MKLSVSTTIATDRDTLLNFLYSPEYLELAAREAKAVSRAEIEQDGEDGVYAVRWFAPTQLPRILKKYEGKAPESVNWLEKAVWDRSTYTASLEVIPDVPDSWHSKYTSDGQIKLVEKGGAVEIQQNMEFSMNFGLIGKALEKLLKNEVEALLSQRLEVVKSHFA